jgi:HEAT repeat protein
MAREQKVAWPERIRSQDAKERREALKDAARAGDRAAIAAATNALTDKDTSVRLEAIRALATIGGDASFETLMPLLDSTDADIRREVSKSLRGLGEPPVEFLKAELARADFTTRPRLLRRLLALGSPAALAPHLRGLVGPNKEKREEACELLRQVVPAVQPIDCAAELLPALGDAVAARDPRALEQVALLIDQLRDPSSAELLASALYHPDHGLRRAAVSALSAQGWMPRTDAERVVFDLARADDRALSRLGDDAVEPLKVLLENACNDLRAQAARALGVLRRTGAEDALTRALGDPVGAVRAASAHALAECAGPRAAKDLARLLKDPDESARTNAEHALTRLGEPIRALLTELAVSSDSAVRSRASRILTAIGNR